MTCGGALHAPPALLRGAPPQFDLIRYNLLRSKELELARQGILLKLDLMAHYHLLRSFVSKSSIDELINSH
ncbi:MAG: hypothetical protein MUO26_00745 [Methanotrichaceae archaeon]|nr:hypothetical protein [Methanotrichaceae archaeon]